MNFSKRKAATNLTEKPATALVYIVSGGEPVRPLRRRRLHRPAHERHGDGERHQGRPRPHRISALRLPRLLLLRLHRSLARLRTQDASSPPWFMGIIKLLRTRE